MTERRNWFKIDEEVIVDSGRFYSKADKFAGAPKALLQKTEERVRRLTDLY